MNSRTFEARKELIEWIMFEQNCLNEDDILFRVSYSAPIDFQELIKKSGVDEPIVYELQKGVVRKHNKYTIDLSLYINKEIIKSGMDLH